MNSSTPAHALPDVNPRPKKKRRPALSCVTCRDRKLKCDKERPRCGRCVQAGPDYPCVYVETHTRQPPAAHLPPSQPSGPPPEFNQQDAARPIRQLDDTPASSRSSQQATRTRDDLHQAVNEPSPGLPALENRLARLESILVQAVNQSAFTLPLSSSELAQSAQPAPDAAPATPAIKSSPADSVEAAYYDLPNCWRDDANEGILYPGGFRRGYGLSHPAMLLSKFTEMPAFMYRIRSEHPGRTQHLKGRIERWRAANMESSELWNESCSFQSAIASLPPKETVDRLVFTYFDTMELEYPILDERKFISAYEDAWDGPTFAPTPALLMQILLVVATTASFLSSQPGGDTPCLESGKKSLRRYIHLSERWLLSRGTQSPDLESARLYCLLVLAKRYNGFLREQVWSTAASMLRVAMLATVHVQAVQTGTDQDACRKLWTTCLELDLLTTCDTGMLPAAPISEYRRVSAAARQLAWQNSTAAPRYAQMALSLALRAEIVCMLNSNNLDIIGKKTAEYEQRIKQHLAALPSPQEVSGETPGSEKRQAHWVELSRAKLQKYLLLVYLPYTLEGQLQTKYSQYKKACVEVAVAILCDHQTFLENGTLAPVLKLDDALQAALLVCHELYQPVQPGIPSLGQLTGYVQLILPILKCALDVLTQRILHVGHYHAEYFFLCLAIGLVKAKMWPENISDYCKEVIEWLDESCSFIESPKTPSTASPAQTSHGKRPSLASPPRSTPHVSHNQDTPLDPATEKEIFTGLDIGTESFQDIVEFLGLNQPWDGYDFYQNGNGHN